jgi:hypothetical protein
MRQKPKTYGRFLGTIYFGEFRALEIPDLQWLAKELTTTNRNNTKKSDIFLPPSFRFSAKSFRFFRDNFVSYFRCEICNDCPRNFRHFRERSRLIISHFLLSN